MTTATEVFPPATDTSPSDSPPADWTAVAGGEGTLVDVSAEARSRTRLWFLGAFLLGLVASLAVAGGALLAYDRAHDGRILPGVRAGGMDLSGMGRQEAALALAAAYSGLREGQVTIHAGRDEVAIPYRTFSRQADIEALIDEAMRTGRRGYVLERAVAEVRMALQGVELTPRVLLDEAALEAAAGEALARLEVAPKDATVSIGANGILMTGAYPGRRFDAAGAVDAAIAAAGRADAPAEVEVEAAVAEVPPARSDADVLAAKAAAERMMGDVVVSHGLKTWTIPATTVRRWLSFDTTADGSFQPVVDQAAVPDALTAVAKAVEVKAVSASYLVAKSGSTVGVTASKDGRQLDRPATSAAIAQALADRGSGAAPAVIPISVTVLKPDLTTEEAQKVAPLMTRLSSWKTWFPIGERNYWGANIWLPAQIINGTVLQPGQTFEWFRALGPITSARGFGPGGVIKGDHTEPTGALAGGMCSSSTTLFNAALRAGLKMGARANHRYYIDRYPLGLDATVSKMGGSTQTVTFTNDMAHPILIRGFKVRGSGGKGWVRYEIWGIPDGRTVSISKPSVANVRQATTKTVEVSTLPTGVRKQTEYPVNGMDVSVTRVVRARDGHVLHVNTYRTHYQLWNGRIEVGV